VRAALDENLIDAAALFDIQIHRGRRLDRAIERVVLEKLAALHDAGGQAGGVGTSGACRLERLHYLPDHHDGDDGDGREHDHALGGQPFFFSMTLSIGCAEEIKMRANASTCVWTLQVQSVRPAWPAARRHGRIELFQSGTTCVSL